MTSSDSVQTAPLMPNPVGIGSTIWAGVCRNSTWAMTVPTPGTSSGGVTDTRATSASPIRRISQYAGPRRAMRRMK